MAIEHGSYLASVSRKTEEAWESRSYPFNIPAIQLLDEIRFDSRVTFFVGENGSGKSTLLEGLAMALGYGPEGGTKNIHFSTADSVSKLHEALRVGRGRRAEDGYFLRAESFFNVATYMDEVGYLKGYGGKSLHKRSHGEAFLALLVQKFRGKGLYLLDEPEAALSPSRQMAALRAIHQLVEMDSQFIIATHSPILLAYPGAKLLHFDDKGIQEVEYEETNHFRLMKDWLSNYPRRIEMLFAEE